MTMSAAVPRTAEPDPPVRIRIEWLELTCLPCGDIAGYVEDRRIVRAVFPDGIRLEHGRLRCGRCNGLLFSGNSGTATSRAGIG